MSRRRRKYWLHEETGIVYRSFYHLRQTGPGSETDLPPSAVSGPSYDDVWLDHWDNSIWQVNFNAHPATVTETTGNNIDGWILNDGYHIRIYEHQLRVSNNAALLTARFRNVPTSVTLPLAVDTVTGELLHG